jgi:hypothetical protein
VAVAHPCDGCEQVARKGSNNCGLSTRGAILQRERLSVSDLEYVGEVCIEEKDRERERARESVRV